MGNFEGAGASGRDGVPLERKHTDLRVHSVDVFVRDQERSIRFYLDKLGFKLAFDARLQSGQRWSACRRRMVPQC